MVTIIVELTKSNDVNFSKEIWKYIILFIYCFIYYKNDYSILFSMTDKL